MQNLLWLSQLRETKKGKLGWKTMRFPLEFWGKASLSEDKTTCSTHKFTNSCAGSTGKELFHAAGLMCNNNDSCRWTYGRMDANPPSAKGQNSHLLSTQVSWRPLPSPYTLIKQYWMHEVHRIWMVGFLLSKHGWGPWDLWMYYECIWWLEIMHDLTFAQLIMHENVPSREHILAPSDVLSQGKWAEKTRRPSNSPSTVHARAWSCIGTS
jgi:hypothetical protein